MADKNEIVKNKILNNEEIRLEGSAKRKAEIEERINPSENVDKYWKKLNEQEKKLLSQLESLSVTTTGDDNKAKRLSDIQSDISELRQYVADCSYFLSSYDSKQSLNLINRLLSKYEETKNKHIPRKKFSFKNKEAHNNTNKSSENEETINKKVNEILEEAVDNEYIIENKENETIIVKNGELKGKDVKISNCKNCIIAICDWTGAIRIYNLNDSNLYAGPITSSLFIENAKNNNFYYISRQTRIHHTYMSNFYCHVSSGPIIEDCNGLRFGIFNNEYDGLENDWKDSGLDRNSNLWNEVKDFKWIKKTHSPNWEEIPQCLKYPDSLLPEVIKVTINNEDDDEI